MSRTTEVIDLRTEAKGCRARNLLELVFIFTLRPCRACGSYDPDLDFRRKEGGMLSSPPETAEYSVWKRCSTCRNWRQIIAHTVPDPDVPSDPATLGGEGPSQIISREDFLRELERLLPDIADDPTTLPYKLWRKASDSLSQALICANELARFPLQENDGPLGRSAVTERQNHLRELSLRYDEDTERYAAEEAAAEGQKMPIGDLNRHAVIAHDLWHGRGQVGEGRMVLKHQLFIGRKIPALPGSFWDDVKLVEGNANLSSFEGAEMHQTTWEESQLQMSRFERALLTKARFVECDMTGARFYSMHLEEGIFDECGLEGAIWTASRCDRVTFLRCDLLDMTFDEAVFTRCDFHRHSLGATERFAYLATSKGAHFEECDLRDVRWTGRDLSHATFVRCKLAGAHGHPRASEGLVLKDCDVTLDELRRMWKAPLPVPLPE